MGENSPKGFASRVMLEQLVNNKILKQYMHVCEWLELWSPTIFCNLGEAGVCNQLRALVLLLLLAAPLSYIS